MGSRTSKDSRKNATGINFARSHAQSRVLIDFSCTVLEIQNIAIPDVLDHGKSYEHGFMKKRNGHKLSRSCKQSRVSIGFSCTVSEIQNTGQIQRFSPW
ncbi:hypothetical protein GW17_00062058 [Ensete ventricosum]|nr:hypothetical protein GW17_00062058 [Ensete ventricosum]